MDPDLVRIISRNGILNYADLQACIKLMKIRNPHEDSNSVAINAMKRVPYYNWSDFLAREDWTLPSIRTTFQRIKDTLDFQCYAAVIIGNLPFYSSFIRQVPFLLVDGECRYPNGSRPHWVLPELLARYVDLNADRSIHFGIGCWTAVPDITAYGVSLQKGIEVKPELSSKNTCLMPVQKIIPGHWKKGYLDCLLRL